MRFFVKKKREILIFYNKITEFKVLRGNLGVCPLCTPKDKKKSPAFE